MSARKILGLALAAIAFFSVPAAIGAPIPYPTPIPLTTTLFPNGPLGFIAPSPNPNPYNYSPGDQFSATKFDVNWWAPWRYTQETLLPYLNGCSYVPGAVPSVFTVQLPVTVSETGCAPGIGTTLSLGWNGTTPIGNPITFSQLTGSPVFASTIGAPSVLIGTSGTYSPTQIGIGSGNGGAGNAFTYFGSSGTAAVSGVTGNALLVQSGTGTSQAAFDVSGNLGIAGSYKTGTTSIGPSSSTLNGTTIVNGNANVSGYASANYFQAGAVATYGLSQFYFGSGAGSGWTTIGSSSTSAVAGVTGNAFALAPLSTGTSFLAVDVYGNLGLLGKVKATVGGTAAYVPTVVNDSGASLGPNTHIVVGSFGVFETATTGTETFAGVAFATAPYISISCGTFFIPYALNPPAYPNIGNSSTTGFSFSFSAAPGATGSLRTFNCNYIAIGS